MKRSLGIVLATFTLGAIFFACSNDEKSKTAAVRSIIGQGQLYVEKDGGIDGIVDDGFVNYLIYDDGEITWNGFVSFRGERYPTQWQDVVVYELSRSLGLEQVNFQGSYLPKEPKHILSSTYQNLQRAKSVTGRGASLTKVSEQDQSIELFANAIDTGISKAEFDRQWAHLNNWYYNWDSAKALKDLLISRYLGYMNASGQFQIDASGKAISIVSGFIEGTIQEKPVRLNFSNQPFTGDNAATPAIP